MTKELQAIVEELRTLRSRLGQISGGDWRHCIDHAQDHLTEAISYVDEASRALARWSEKQP